MSIFQSLSELFPTFQDFWLEVPVSSFRYSGFHSFSSLLSFKSHSNQYSELTVYLYKDTIFYYHSPEIVKLAHISWYMMETFVEDSLELDTKFGFSLISIKDKIDFFTSSEEILNQWVDNLSSLLIMTGFEYYFVVIKELGCGQFGTVSLCQEIETGKLRAVKKINKKSLSSKVLLRYCYNEISIQKEVNHPNVVKLLNVYESPDEIALVLEYVNGGTLYKKIENQEKLDEMEVMHFSKKLLELENYFAKLGIIHRDIKPENILLELNQDLSHFKLADFGLACYEDDTQRTCLGSLGYMAPEMLRGLKYNSKADLFSSGVVIYTLLTCQPLFEASSMKSLLQKNSACKINFKSKKFKKLSMNQLKFLSLVLNPEPELRPSPSEILRCEWFKTY